MAELSITEFTGPACPFAWSAEPLRRRLEWLFGEHLEWELRMVGLSSSPEDYTDRGFTPERLSTSLRSLSERHHMPMDTSLRERMSASLPACRAVVATRLNEPERERALLRRLRVRHFAGEPLDENSTLEGAARDVGIAPSDLSNWIADPATAAALEQDLQLTRHPSPEAVALKHKLSSWSEGWRYTCLRRRAGAGARAARPRGRGDTSRLRRPLVPIHEHESEVGSAMEHRTLGSTGVRVSPLCLGAMMFGSWGNTDHEDSIRIIHAALDAGINFIDTADVYSAGESEEIVGKALAGRREEVVLATKLHGNMGDQDGRDPNKSGNSRRWIFQEVERSLTRLKTDWIDLYQVHRPEPETDIEETLGALSDLVHQGKVRYIGSSTFPPSQVVEAQWASRKRGLQRFVCEQPPYSMLVRGIEGDLLPTALRHGMGVIPWSPLAGGWLSGAWRKGREAPSSTRAQRLPARYDLSLPGNQRKLDAVEELAQLAEQTGISLIHLALAFVIRHPAVTAAIIGPRTMEQLQSQLGAEQVVLSEEVLGRIDEIVAPASNVNPADGGWQDPALEPAARRR